ncbi:uncharacterized protein BJ212DRAFT_439030 [Suillus subaureus]|uniref:Uncharacterized protein n=1 Tax=Suillus subaureus TaxID=48587 RepID=A0A9P7JBL6_9AGAM|nr:uncharacterized protein BJ212DRAFT_439030 [Suillus subaureus]KAG1812908.1 hypothetical protein BJ212DRAFT_439030 [Suillus subaureus]
MWHVPLFFSGNLISTMATVTKASLQVLASTESNLSDANGTPKSPFYQASTVIADGTPLQVNRRTQTITSPSSRTTSLQRVES